MKGNYSAATLRNRLERLEESLRNEKMRLHRQIDDTGWGAGMRRTRCTPSFRRKDEFQARIEALRAQLREAEAEAR